MDKHIVRIIQPDAKDGKATSTQGTRVMLGDGSELSGVTKIVLTAEVNSIWQAEIHCFATFESLSASAVIHRMSRWDRFKQWLRFG